jgi:hypothetical protein
MKEDNYKYKAFISYSHKDEKFVEWLHEALENYDEFHKKYDIHIDIAKKIFPIFRDKEEFSVSSSLSKEILNALKFSEYLIVICSIDSAKSKWVNQEILDFKIMHGDSKILSIIINGEPYGGDKDECFPKALKYNVIDGKLSSNQMEPLAINIKKFFFLRFDWNYGKIKLISSLLNIEFSKLYKREKRRKRNVKIIYIALISFFILFMSTMYYKLYLAGKEVTKCRIKLEKCYNENYGNTLF